MSLDSNARAELKARTKKLITLASEEFRRGAITVAEWQRRASDALADAYLRDADPRWQSGFDGDARLWKEARSLVLLAAPTSGTFLDVGCANGHLIESLLEWAPERGRHLDVYGLELNPSLAEAARQRLPALADHIFVGNVREWRPSLRFSCVRTGLEYVPAGEECRLLAHIAAELLEPDGRVAVGPIDDRDVDSARAAFDAAGLAEPRVVSETDHRGKTRHVVWSSIVASTAELDA